MTERHPDGASHAFSILGCSGMERDIDFRWSVIAAPNRQHASNIGNPGFARKDVIGPESLDILI
jgi:hypothetical protein